MQNEIANKLDTRAEYIRQLTQSLSKGNSTGIAEDMADDVSSVGGDTVTSVLYKYGKEASTVDSDKTTAVRGSGSFVGSKMNKRASSSAQSLDTSIEGMSELKSAESAARESSTAPYYDDPHMQFLINKEQNKGRSTQKLVSGSQFRNTTKLGTGRCEQCMIFDRVNKKHKETIRSLRLQIARLEETAHDLRRLKSNDSGHHVALKGSTSGGSALAAAMSQDDEEDEMENIQFLASKCETYEADLAKMKKMLLYERTLNEGLRKTLDETRTGLREELAAAQTQIGKLTEEHAREKDRREGLQVANDDLTTTLLRYKQQLERSENKLSDCVL